LCVLRAKDADSALAVIDVAVKAAPNALRQGDCAVFGRR